MYDGGGAMPGGAMPGGAIPGGIPMPGGAIPGGAIPGGAIPGGIPIPGGAIPGGAIPGGSPAYPFSLSSPFGGGNDIFFLILASLRTTKGFQKS